MFNFVKHLLGYQLGVVLAMLKVINKRDKVIIILKFYSHFMAIGFSYREVVAFIAMLKDLKYEYFIY